MPKKAYPRTFLSNNCDEIGNQVTTEHGLGGMKEHFHRLDQMPPPDKISLYLEITMSLPYGVLCSPIDYPIESVKIGW
jgi:hypothetical protein